MKDSYGTYDGRIAEPPYECPRCAELEAALAAIKAEGHFAYGCSAGHDAVSYYAKPCPVCALRQRHAEAVEQAYREGLCEPSCDPDEQCLSDDELWLASEAKARLEGEHETT